MSGKREQEEVGSDAEDVSEAWESNVPGPNESTPEKMAKRVSETLAAGLHDFRTDEARLRSEHSAAELALAISSAGRRATASRPAHIKPRTQQVGEVSTGSEEEELARAIMLLKARRDDLKEQEKDNNKELDAVEQRLAALMEARGMNLFRIEGLGTFSTSVKNFPSCSDQAALAAWLDENGMGSISKRSVHPSTLKGWVNDRLKEGKQLPQCINNFTKTCINTRKA